MDHDGIFDASKAYSHKAIARILGKKERWVIQEVLRDGLAHRKLGNLYMVAGHILVLWIERTSTEWIDVDQDHDDES